MSERHQDELLLSQGFYKIGSGYLHNVYERDGLIYKCLKPEFSFQNSYGRLSHEMAVMEYLRTQGIPTVQVHKVIKEGDILPDRCFLVEDKAKGVNYTKDTISIDKFSAILSYILHITEIECPFFGSTKPLSGEHRTWKEYLHSCIRRYFENSDLGANVDNAESFMHYLIDRFVEEPNLPRFLIMDSNPSNFFFDEEDDICNIIDIDHPVFGDPLYQVASIMYENFELARTILPSEIEIDLTTKAYAATVFKDYIVKANQQKLLVYLMILATEDYSVRYSIMDNIHIAQERFNLIHMTIKSAVIRGKYD